MDTGNNKQHQKLIADIGNFWLRFLSSSAKVIKWRSSQSAWKILDFSKDRKQPAPIINQFILYHFFHRGLMGNENDKTDIYLTENKIL